MPSSDRQQNKSLTEYLYQLFSISHFVIRDNIKSDNANQCIATALRRPTNIAQQLVLAGSSLFRSKFYARFESGKFCVITLDCNLFCSISNDKSCLDIKHTHNF